MKRIVTAVLMVALFLAPAEAGAQLQASFRAEYLNYNGSVADCDTTISGLPTCELYFRMGVFQSDSVIGDLLTHPEACGSFSLDTGEWNFPNQTVTRELPDMSNVAQVYFALYDEDPSDEHDLLGTHFQSFAGPVSPLDFNNNLLKVLEACDGGAVDDDSQADRFQLSYDLWFTDESEPLAPPGPPSHNDDDSNPGYDNDSNLDFTWLPGSDPNSGISGYDFSVRVNGAPSSSGNVSATALTISGATEGNTYDVAVRSVNGAVVALNNQQGSVYTAFSAPVAVDMTADEIESLSAYTEFGGEAIGDGVGQPDNTPYMEWAAAKSYAPIDGYSTSTTGTPDGDVDTELASTTLGPLPPGPTTFRVRAIDDAGNCGPVATFEIIYLPPVLDFLNGFELILDG